MNYKETIKISRDVWKWLYKNPDKSKKEYPHFDKIKNFVSECSLCEYHQNANITACSNCILYKQKQCHSCNLTKNLPFYHWKNSSDRDIRKENAYSIYKVLDDEWKKITNKDKNLKIIEDIFDRVDIKEKLTKIMEEIIESRLSNPDPITVTETKQEIYIDPYLVQGAICKEK